jgi:hypothetical protein
MKVWAVPVRAVEVAAKDEIIKYRKVESCVLTDKPTLQQSN